MKVPSQLRGFARVTVSVFFALAFAFVTELLLHTDEVHYFQHVQQRSINSVKKFTPWEFASRFIQELSEPDDSKEALLRMAENNAREIASSAARFNGLPASPPRADKEPAQRVEDVRQRSLRHWQKHFTGPMIVFRPPIALAVVLFTTFPSLLSLGFILTVAELALGGLFVFLYIVPRIPSFIWNIWGPLNIAIFVLLTIAAGTVVSAISLLAAQVGLVIFGKFLSLAESLSVWLTTAGIAGFLAMKYTEVIAHHKAEVLAAKALDIE